MDKTKISYMDILKNISKGKIHFKNENKKFKSNLSLKTIKDKKDKIKKNKK